MHTNISETNALCRKHCRAETLSFCDQFSDEMISDTVTSPGLFNMLQKSDSQWSLRTIRGLILVCF